jgi:hypothetical protein
VKAFDWNDEASRMADHVCAHMFSSHRGAMAGQYPGTLVLFGNDGYAQDERTRELVERLGSAVTAGGLQVLGFGVNQPDSYSWALIIRCDADEWSLQVATALVWDEWSEGRPDHSAFMNAQTRIAIEAVDEGAVARGPGLN